MNSLTSGQRRYLRGLANQLDPVILIGKGGASESVLNAVDDALEAHELIKIRFNDFKDEKKALTDHIARETQAEVAGLIGHVAILYRRHPDPKKRKIQLPDPAGAPGGSGRKIPGTKPDSSKG